jgi:hypothetical protein
MTVNAPDASTMPAADLAGGGPFKIPIEIHAAVASVAGALAMSPHALLGGIDDKAARGRRMAAALVARRNMLTAPSTAVLFGMGVRLVGHAMATLDAILVVNEISATHMPLAPLVAKIVAEWDRFEDLPRQRTPIDEIQEVVARVFRVSLLDIRSARREQRVAMARQTAMYLARRFTLDNLARIGHAFGGRDHSTVSHALKRMTPHAEAVAEKLATSCSVEDWARALMEDLARTRSADAPRITPSSTRAA